MSSNRSGSSHSLLKRTSVFCGIENLEDLRLVGLGVGTRSASRVIGGRVTLRPVGSPIMPVMSPIRKITVWPRS